MRLDHVGIAVESIDAVLPFYREQLGLTVVHREEVPGQKVRVAFLGSPKGEGSLIELLEPTEPEGPVASFLNNRGPGLHHVAFETDGIEHAMERLKAAGRPPLDSKPRDGARGHKVCFVHPKHANGVLIELVEPQSGEERKT